MVKGIDDVCDVLTHVAVDIPFTCKKFRCLVDKVGGKYSVDGTFFVSLFEFLEAVGE